MCPVALLGSSRVPTRLLSSLLYRGSPLRSHCCQGPREGSILIPRPRDNAWCWDCAQGPMQWPLCGCAQVHIFVPASSPKGKWAPNRARAGGGSLEGFNCWLPFTHDFPVSVLSSWHPSCSLYMYIIYCCLVVPVCMLHPLFCKALEQYYLQALSGCSGLLVKVTGEPVSVSTKEKKRSVFFLLGGKFDQLQVTPAAVKPYCLYAPVVWLVSSYGLVSDFCARCRINRAKKILRHGLQHAAMIIPIPKPQDPLRYA